VLKKEGAEEGSNKV